MRLRWYLLCGPCRRKACLSCLACISLLTIVLLTGLHWTVQGWFLYLGGMTFGDEMERDIPIETQGRLKLFGGDIQPLTSLQMQPPPGGVDHTHCPTSSATTLFYTRIPKCASTSFVYLIESLSAMSNFTFAFHPSGAYSWDEQEMRNVANLCKEKLALKKRLLYARHFYYLDFTPFGLKNFTYAAVIREPVSRVVSSYIYYHFSPKKHIQDLLDPKYRNETLQSCLEHQHNGCVGNLLTRYFCGHSNWCQSGNDQALQEAKKNLRYNFAVVGIVENMELTLEVIKAVLPQFFGQARHETLPSRNMNRESLKLSEAERRQVAEANAADVELYSYAVQLLHEKAKQCGLGDRLRV